MLRACARGTPWPRICSRHGVWTSCEAPHMLKACARGTPWPRICSNGLMPTHHPYDVVLRGEGGAEVRRPHATLPSWRAYAGSDAVHYHHRQWCAKASSTPPERLIKHSSIALDRALPEVVVKRVIPSVASARQPPDACAWKLRSHGMAAKIRGYGGVPRGRRRRCWRSARSGNLEECSIRRLGGVLDPAPWGSARSGALGECSIRRLGGVLDPAPWGSA